MGGVNSQVLLNETEIEAAVRDLRALLGPVQVRTKPSGPLQTAVRHLLRRLRRPDELCGVCLPSLRPEWVWLSGGSCRGAQESAGFLRDERKREKRRFLLCWVSMVTRPRHTCALVNKSWNLGLSTALDLFRLIFSLRRA